MFFRGDKPEEMSGYGWAVHCYIRRREKNRIQHQRGHDGVQELIWSICKGFLFLLLPVCMWLKEGTRTKIIIIISCCALLTVAWIQKDLHRCHSLTMQKSNYTFILSARRPKATIMSPGLLIFFSTRRVWEKRVGEYDRPSFGTVAQKFSSSLPKIKRWFLFDSATCYCGNVSKTFTLLRQVFLLFGT